MDDIEAELQQRAVREVTSTEVGEAVLQSLKQLSEVAYVRFASVYRQFQGITDFVEELRSLQTGQTLAAPMQGDSEDGTEIAEADRPDSASAPVISWVSPT